MRWGHFCHRFYAYEGSGVFCADGFSSCSKACGLIPNPYGYRELCLVLGSCWLCGSAVCPRPSKGVWCRESLGKGLWSVAHAPSELRVENLWGFADTKPRDAVAVIGGKLWRRSSSNSLQLGPVLSASVGIVCLSLHAGVAVTPIPCSV